VGTLSHARTNLRGAGIAEIVLPADNEADLEDIADEVRRELKFHFVETLDEAIAIGLRLAAGRELSKMA
jgi:ATP-dependent Lon protease